MDIIISSNLNKPIYEQIVAQLKEQIMDGTLKPGEALPSIRALAKELHISVITIKKAYELLQRDGFIDSVVGKGSFVANLNKDFLKEEKQREIEEYLEKSVQIARESGIQATELKDLIDFFYEQDE